MTAPPNTTVDVEALEMRDVGSWLTVLCDEHLAERLAKEVK